MNLLIPLIETVELRFYSFLNLPTSPILEGHGTKKQVKSRCDKGRANRCLQKKRLNMCLSQSVVRIMCEACRNEAGPSEWTDKRGVIGV